MDIFLTLVALRQHEGALYDALEGLEAALSHPEVLWLSEGTACDLYVATDDPTQIEKIARQTISNAPIDFLADPREKRRKKLLIADMDSTFVTSETLDDMAAHMGLKNEIASITARSMRGELDFESSVRMRVRMIAGLPLSAIQETLARVQLSPGARSLSQTMRRHGAYTALVSGGFTIFTEEIHRQCHFHEHRSNVLGVEESKLTGEIVGPVVGQQAKLEALNELTERYGITHEDVLAIGDGANDMDMIQAAGLGIAYYGKPVLAELARANIRHTDLTTALYFQGYSDAEIIGAKE